MEENEILVGTADYNEAKRLSAALSEKGVKLRISTNAESCEAKGRCMPKFDIFVDRQSIETVVSFLNEERTRAYEGLNVDLQLKDQVFDTEQAMATCPACGTQLSTSVKACPECGLVFIIEE